MHHGTVLDRMARTRCTQCVVMLFAFTLTSGFVRNTCDLVRLNREKATEIADREDTLRRACQRHDDLVAAKRFYQSDNGIIAAGRPYGYGRPGERRVMFEAAEVPTQAQ
jgi:hypothetical protein